MEKFRENGTKLEMLSNGIPVAPGFRSTASVLVEGRVRVPSATMDSGSQVPGVATAGLLAALTEAGIPVDLVALNTPVTMNPYGE